MAQSSEATRETAPATSVTPATAMPVRPAAGMAPGPRATQLTQLTSEHGRTTIADGVVARIAVIAAREVPGVHELVGQGAGDMLAGFTQRVTGGGASPTQGVNVEVGAREAAVDLRMTVDYGVSIAQVAEAVRRNVINRVQGMTGLTVKEVNIDVTDLYFPEGSLPQPPTPGAAPAPAPRVA
jgi:uncharacterized alkaline shock family protein YloU